MQTDNSVSDQMLSIAQCNTHVDRISSNVQLSVTLSLIIMIMTEPTASTCTVISMQTNRPVPDQMPNSL